MSRLRVASRAQVPDFRFRLNNRAVLSVGIGGYFYDFDHPAEQSRGAQPGDQEARRLHGLLTSLRIRSPTF
jgi:hypothetical protein